MNNSKYEPIWRNGEVYYPLYDMDTRHIENALAKYKRNGYAPGGWHKKHSKLWIKEFNDELTARKGESWAHESLEDIKRARALRRLILGLPPVRPRDPKYKPKKLPKPKVKLEFA